MKSVLVALCLGVAMATPSLSQTPAAASLAVAAPAAASPVLLQPPEIAARAYLLVDLSANQVLAEKDSNKAVEPASLTKLMTAYLVFDALRAKKLDRAQKIQISERAWKMPGSRMFIDPKMQVPVDDLIKGMIVQSGNDATVALAETVGGTVERFVQLMNAQAQALGMTATTYKNPEGLTAPGHTTTARDLATLSRRLILDFPDDVKVYAIQKYRYPGTPAMNDSNRNLLLFRDPTVDGLKTGHTDAAGYCLIATARRDFPNLKGRRLLSVLLGASSESARANESQKLLNWGYTAYDALKLYDANQSAATPRIWKGQANEVKLGRPEPIVVAVPAGEHAKIVTRIIRPEPIHAPQLKGQPLGSLQVSLGDRVIAEKPLEVLESVEQAGFVGRAWDAVRLWIQ